MVHSRKIPVTDEMRKTFPARLKKLRRDAGHKQLRLSLRADVTMASLQAYENGRIFPGDQALERLAEALGISVQHLLGIETSEGDSVRAAV